MILCIDHPDAIRACLIQLARAGAVVRPSHSSTRSADYQGAWIVVDGVDVAHLWTGAFPALHVFCERSAP